MVMRMLKEVYNRVEGRLPLAELCHATLEKVYADEVVNNLVQATNKAPKRKDVKFQDPNVAMDPKYMKGKSTASSPASSWAAVSGANQNDTDLLTADEKIKLQEIISQREAERELNEMRCWRRKKSR